MRKVLFASVLILAFTLTLFAQEDKATDEELALIKQAALDYVDGFYAGDGDRVAKGVHPSLQKVTIRKMSNGRETFDFSDQELLVEAAKGNVMKIPLERRNVEVTVFDVFENIAAVKIDSLMFEDYANIAKINGEWRVINVLWGMTGTNLPETTEEDREAIEQASLDYIDGLFEGNGARVEKGMHPTLHKVAVRRLRNGREFFYRIDRHRLVEIANAGFDKKPAEERKIKVSIFHTFKNIATVKIDSVDFVDYAHVVKINGQWQVINVLWANKQT